MKAYSSPSWDDGALIPADDEIKGQLSPHSAKLIMKLMWLCRISRPDVTFAVTLLAKHITVWSANDDKRVARLIGYLQKTHEYSPIMCIRDPPEQLNLSLYCDADFGGDIKSMRSTSGFILAVSGPSSFAPVSWGSKRQS